MSPYPSYQDLDKRTPVSLFEEVRRHPALEDWVYETRMLRAPDRSFRMDASWFATRGSIGVYSTVARYAQSRDKEDAQPLRHLLRALSQLPTVLTFLDDLREVIGIMSSFASDEGLILNQWAKNQPYVRATGRHPDGWVLTVGCLYLGPGEWEFYSAIAHDIYMALTCSRQYWGSPTVHAHSPLPSALPHALFLKVLELKQQTKPDVDVWETHSDLRQDHQDDLLQLPLLSRFAIDTLGSGTTR